MSSNNLLISVLNFGENMMGKIRIRVSARWLQKLGIGIRIGLIILSENWERNNRHQKIRPPTLGRAKRKGFRAVDFSVDTFLARG
ncbi:MAG: hypothetical protein A3G59_03310 [Candidatus Taylorbacteria bacterium RIFCSPLOWO2_12_FULL_47_20]|uniref:Uncharacterized protein n=2 Tax=Candidatus Tayloriibacteriota TaxID=1817919 RepID=A0A1G2P6L5_9BACT|nr:MAG: hypothetical protein A3H68_03345 [Candidatus Taylorbacteria bacterium RIFCSPLOWO2_02_FULL_46_40]OHA43994.1 MAG: hypothetical protein A3G59_03310 [Candidatus Taylorbacteria bacterium RIFCSPLOWO2_12_FULL_47_20]